MPQNAKPIFKSGRGGQAGPSGSGSGGLPPPPAYPGAGAASRQFEYDHELSALWIQLADQFMNSGQQGNPRLYERMGLGRDEHGRLRLTIHPEIVRLRMDNRIDEFENVMN